MIRQSVGSDASPLSCFLFRPRKSREKRRKRSHINASNASVIRTSTPLAQTAHVRFRGRKRVHARLSEKDRTQRLTRRNTGLPSLVHSVVLCCRRYPFYSTTLLYTYISRFSVNPQHQQKRIIRQSCHHKFYPQPLFNFSYKRPTFAFTSESGHTLGFRRRIAHKGLHGETGAVSDGGGIITLDTSCTFTNIPGPGIRTANFAAFGPWPGALSKNAESLRDSDALMRVAVPRRRGPAGLRDLFRFCRNCGLYTLRSGPFRVCEARGGITTLSALYVLLKHRIAACQKG